jgi:hypothetical protein
LMTLRRIYFLCFSIDMVAMQQKRTNVKNLTPTGPIM